MEGNSSRFSLTAPFTTTSRASEIHSLGSARCLFFVSCDILEIFVNVRNSFVFVETDTMREDPTCQMKDEKMGGVTELKKSFFPFFGAALYPSDSS
jgi:hypothetical protein